jgi:serine/threonine-protein kinase
MTTGRLPFKAEYDQAVMYSILNEQPPPAPSLRPGMPAVLASIIDRALAKTPDKRYQHVSEMLDDLESVRESGRGRDISAKTGEQDVEHSLPSIAVLPFVNMSPDPENAYFGDGLAEELINGLSRLGGLRVAARTSAFRFRGEDVDIREIGHQLGVSTVLEGSVRKSGNRLRVTAQLINIEDGYHLWSERYDREMKDIFDIQDEIAAAIVKQLEVKLAVKKGQPLIKRYTENLEAYSLFLKGQYHLFSLKPEGWAKSFELYQQAIELDPSFALAHAWQSQNYQSLCFWGDGRPRQEMENSRSAARAALQLDEDLALARAVMAVIYWSYDWHWTKAEQEFKRVFELDPTEPFNHVNYSLFLAAAGRTDEALAEAELGQKLDPLSSIIASWGGITLVAAGRYGEAVDCLQRAIALDPGHWQAHYQLSRTFLHTSDINQAQAASRKAMELSGEASATLKEAAVIHYLSGNPDAGDWFFAQLSGRANRGYVSPCMFAEIHLARGEREEALKYLEQAIRERDPWLVLIGLNPPQTRPTGLEMETILGPVGFPISS